MTFWRKIVFGLMLPVHLMLGRGITGTLQGIVRDRSTNTPLPAVNITIIGIDRGTVTDVDGTYRIANVRAGVYDVRFTMIGYSAVVMTRVAVLSDLRTTLDVGLEPSAVEMAAVEVLAERPLIQKDLAATAFTIGDRHVDRLPVSSFQEIVSMQPGITREGNVRGGRASELVYFIDGVPIQDVVGGGLGALLPKDAITSLTIWTGGFDAEYGNALSGIVNVVTKTGSNTHAFAARIERDQWLPQSWSRQTNRSTEFEFSASGPVIPDRLYYYTANTISFSDTRWWQDMQHFFSSPIQKELSGFSKLEFVPTPTFRLSIQSIYSTQSWRDYEFSWRYNLSGLPARSRDAVRGSVQLSHTISQETYYTLAASVFYLRGRTGTGRVSETPLPYVYDVFLRYIIEGQRNWWADNRQYVYSLRADVTSQILPDHMMKIGGELNQYDVDTDVEKFEPQVTYFGKPVANAPLLNYSNSYSYRPRSGAVFLQDKWDIRSQGSIMTIGLRWDFLDPRAQRPLVEFIPVRPGEYEERLDGYAAASVKGKLSPRFSFTGPFSTASYLYINYGKYYQFPVFDYLYSGINPVQLRYGTKNMLAGNPDLEPEELSSWEIGVKHALRNDMVLSITYFQKQYKNQLDSKTLVPFDSKAAGDFGFSTYVNNAEASATGIEVVVSKEQQRGLYGSVSYSYMVAEGLTEYADQRKNLAQWGFPIAPKPYPLSWDQRHTVKADLNILLPFGIESNVTALAHSARPYTYYPTRDGFTASDTAASFVPNNGRMKMFSLIDVKFTRRFDLTSTGSAGATIYADIRNVLNVRNVLWMDSNGRSGGELGDPSAFDLPRRVRIGAKFEF